MIKKINILAILVFTLVACKKEPTKRNKDNITSTTNTAINANTLVLTKDITSGDLVAIDSTHLTFKSSSSGASKIVKGSIVVSGISAIAPYGFLRKVNSITNSNGSIVCITEQASITDVVNNCNVTFSKSFSDGDIDKLTVNKYGGKNKGTTSIAGTGTFAKSFVQPFNFILYDKDNNPLTIDDQITFNGNLTFNTTFNLQFVISNFHITKFHADVLLTTDQLLNLQANILSNNLHKETTIFSYEMAPVEVDLGIPLVIVPKINIILGVDGTLSATMTAGVESTSTVNPALDYENNAWTYKSPITNQSFNPKKITFEGAATIKPYIEAQLEFRPYGIEDNKYYHSSIYISSKVFLDGNASVTPSGLSSSLQWGVEFAGAAEMSILDVSILPFHNKSFFQKEFPIWKATSLTAPVLPKPSANSITQTSVELRDTVLIDGGSPVIERGLCWSISPNPNITNNKKTSGSGLGDFFVTLAGLKANTLYYVKGYAINAIGTGYSDEITFTTSSNLPPRTGITVAGGNGYGAGLNQLLNPVAVSVDNSLSVFVADIDAHRIVRWDHNSISGITILGPNIPGYPTVLGPEAVFVDYNKNVYIADANNNAILNVLSGSTMPITVAGGNGDGSLSNQLTAVVGMAVNNSGDIFVLEQSQHRVVEWKKGTSNGIIVAGGNGKGSASNQFGDALGICLDSSGNIYIADYENNRIQRWSPGASEGVIVAGGNGKGSSPNQLSAPEGVFVDLAGNIYVSDTGNNRIQKWQPNTLSGVTVAGGNGAGPNANQLNNPVGLFIDSEGNIYVADEFNLRIQKWPKF